LSVVGICFRLQSSYKYIHKPQLQGKEGYWLIICGAVIVAEFPFQDNLKEKYIYFRISQRSHQHGVGFERQPPQHTVRLY